MKYLFSNKNSVYIKCLYRLDKLTLAFLITFVESIAAMGTRSWAKFDDGLCSMNIS